MNRIDRLELSRPRTRPAAVVSDDLTGQGYDVVFDGDRILFGELVGKFYAFPEQSVLQGQTRGKDGARLRLSRPMTNGEVNMLLGVDGVISITELG